MLVTEVAASGAYAPRYQRIADDIRRQIRAGELAPGAQLDAETTLQKRYAVSLPTVRKAIALLRSEGLLRSMQGVGTFVVENRRLQRRSRHRYGRARRDRQLLSNAFRHEILGAGRGQAPEDVAQAFDVPPETMFVIRRRLLRDWKTDEPVELGASYLSIDIAGGTFLEQPTVTPKALFLCVEDFAAPLTYVHAEDHYKPRRAGPEEAALLRLAPGTPVMENLHTARANDGTVLEVAVSVWESERFVLIDEYDITQEPDADEASASDI